MTTPVTSPAALPAARDIPLEFFRFLKRPELIGNQSWRTVGNFRRWVIILALQVVGLFILLPLLSQWQELFDLPAPTAFEDIDPKLLPWLVILIAPVVEEIVFRGWQSGRPRALWLMACATVGTVATAAVVMGSASQIAVALIFLGSLLAALIGWIVLRRKQAPAWFAQSFPAIFYIAAALFAAMHLFNYPSFSLLSLPLVLPQAWAGLTLGYLRQQVGLTGSIAAHAVSNGLMLAVATVVGG